MQQNLPYKLEKKIDLPLIDLLDKTELAFSQAFFQAARTLHSYLQEILSSIALVINTDTERYNIAIIGLFSKLIRSYYSYVLLEIHRDRVGSQLLIEELFNTAVTLVYLLETADREIFNDYVSASIYQARLLLQEVETQLLQVSNKLELLELRDRLQAFVAEQKQPASQGQLASLAAGLWGREANTTDKRAALLGLNFLGNPARQIAQKITPASWIDVQLNYSNSAISNSQVSNSHKIDFQQLRDTSHICLHATKALLAEVVQLSDESQAEIQRRQQDLNRFFEWFYQAERAYSGGSDASLKSNKNGGH